MNLFCRTLIFDLDGVLLDSNSISERHWRRWAEPHGIAPAPILAAHHGRPTIETIKLFAPHLDAASEAQAKETLEAADTEGLAAYAGAVKILKALPPERWAVVTSGTRPTATFRLHHVGLPLPTVMVTADDVEQGKPAPDPYLSAIVQLGVQASDCIVIEDAPAGITAAKAAGTRVIAIASTNQPKALNEADTIVPQLTDIQVESSEAGLAVKIGAIA